MESIKRLFTNDNIMLVLVLINTGIIFISGFIPDYGGLLLIIDCVFTILFLIEALVKIQVQGFVKYWSDGWNRFDFILVMLALPSCINVFGDILPGTGMLLSLRTMRAFKAFRMLKFVPNIDKLLNGIKLAFKASYLVTFGLIVLLLVLASLRLSSSAVCHLNILAIQHLVYILFFVCLLLKVGTRCLRQLHKTVVYSWLYLHVYISLFFFFLEESLA